MILKINQRRIQPKRIFCIGRNYVAHARELNNEVPQTPVIFMKPATALLPQGKKISFPAHGRELHQEAELVVVIGCAGKSITEDEAGHHIAGLSLGFDLTLRDVQNELKKKGLPWEMAKAFEQSAPLGDVLPYEDSIDLTDIHFTCLVNGEVRQEGDTGLMIFPVKTLIATLSNIWHLQEGDLIFTGTPAGVGPVNRGDRIELQSPLLGRFAWEIE